MYHAEPMSAAAAEILAPLRFAIAADAQSAEGRLAVQRAADIEADAVRRELDAVRRLLWIAANRSKHGALRFTDDELAAAPNLPGVSVVPSPGGFTIVAHRDGDGRVEP